MARNDVIVFENVSDVTPPAWGLTDEELFRLCDRRFAALTPAWKRPNADLEKRLHAWLDQRGVYPKGADLETRVRRLPTEGLIDLLYTLGDWREEKNPPGEDGELE